MYLNKNVNLLGWGPEISAFSSFGCYQLDVQLKAFGSFCFSLWGMARYYYYYYHYHYLSSYIKQLPLHTAASSLCAAAWDAPGGLDQTVLTQPTRRPAGPHRAALCLGPLCPCAWILRFGEPGETLVQTRVAFRGRQAACVDPDGSPGPTLS